MSIIDRFTGFPYEDGDVLSAGTEAVPDGLELDVVRLFNEFNGGIDDSNIKALAGIQGSKIAPSSIPGDRIGPLAVSNDKLKPSTLAGENIKDGEVLLEHLQDNSVSSAEGQFSFGAFTVPGTETPIVTASILTGADPTQVLIVWSFSVIPQTPNDFVSVSTPHELSIKRGNVTVYRSTNASICESGWAGGELERTCYSIVHMDSNPPASSMVTYTCSALGFSGGHPHNITDNWVTLLNVRR